MRFPAIALLCLLALSGCAARPVRPVDPLLPPPVPAMASQAPRRYAVGAGPTVVTLLWDAPTNGVSPDMSYNLYSAGALTLPLTNWAVVTNTTNQTVTLSIQPGNHFFFVTASNLFGESDPSNLLGPPALPPLRISR